MYFFLSIYDSISKKLCPIGLISLTLGLLVYNRTLLMLFTFPKEYFKFIALIDYATIN
jgi:hypothetical protein